MMRKILKYAELFMKLSQEVPKQVITKRQILDIFFNAFKNKMPIIFNTFEVENIENYNVTHQSFGPTVTFDVQIKYDVKVTNEQVNEIFMKSNLREYIVGAMIKISNDNNDATITVHCKPGIVIQ